MSVPFFCRSVHIVIGAVHNICKNLFRIKGGRRNGGHRVTSYVLCNLVTARMYMIL